MDVSVVNQTVQVTCLLIKFHEVLISQVFLIGSKWGQDHLKACLELVFGEVLLQPVEIELIADEIFIDLR